MTNAAATATATATAAAASAPPAPPWQYTPPGTTTTTTLGGSGHPDLLVRWFVQYNPMFTASALCVLGGVLLLSRAMGVARSFDVDVALTGVLELYQWVVIGVAALLYRRLLERRPAVFLGVIALVFLVDPTLQLAALAGWDNGAPGVGATVVQVALFGLKLQALAWAFRLRVSTSARLLPVVIAGVIAAVPQLRIAGVGDDVLPMLLAVAVFVVGVVLGAAPLRIGSRQALGDDGEVVFARVQRAAVAIGVAGALYQCGNAVLAIGPGALLPAIAAGLFVVVVFADDERLLWACAGFGLFLTAFDTGVATVVGLPLCCLSLALAARRHEPRVLTAAVVAGLAAALLSGPPFTQLPGAVVVVVVAAMPLAWALWARRGWSAGVVLAGLCVKAGDVVGVVELAPRGPLQWGAVLVAAGFVLLPAGVVLHRRLSRVLARADADRALALHDAEVEAACAGPNSQPVGEPGGASTSAMVPSLA